MFKRNKNTPNFCYFRNSLDFRSKPLSLVRLSKNLKIDNTESKDRRFGEVYLALDKKSKDQVVVKKVQMKVDDSTVQNEVKMLKECCSKYIVRYYDLVRVGNEVWVRLSKSG